MRPQPKVDHNRPLVCLPWVVPTQQADWRGEKLKIASQLEEHGGRHPQLCWGTKSARAIFFRFSLKLKSLQLLVEDWRLGERINASSSIFSGNRARLHTAPKNLFYVQKSHFEFFFFFCKLIFFFHFKLAEEK